MTDWPEFSTCNGGILPPEEKHDAESIPLELALTPLKSFAARAPADAAAIATLAGAPSEVAWTIFHLATLNTIGAMRNVLRELGIDPRAELFANVEFVQPDWSVIAGRAIGEDDFARWRAYAASHTRGIVVNERKQ